MIKEFDRSRLRLLPLSEREHDLKLDIILQLSERTVENEYLQEMGKAICRAKKQDGSVILMMGAHVLRSGVQNYLIDLLERKIIDCLCMNGAGCIHDFEMALVGATTESVARYISDGRFGLWHETSVLNDVITSGAKKNLGLGECVGEFICSSSMPYKNYSILGAAYKNNIPATVHVGIGYDITHEMPNCDGAAYGATSYRDFMKFCSVVERLEDGVVMNFGSAVMAPEVFLKGLSMARNVAFQQGRTISNFSTLVCDLVELPKTFDSEAPKDSPGYYFRPWKTMLVRTVKDGGKSYYVRGFHRDTFPQLYSAIKGEAEGVGLWSG